MGDVFGGAGGWLAELEGAEITPHSVKLVRAATDAQKAEAYALRYRILVDDRVLLPPNPSGLETDGFDATSHHWLVYSASRIKPIAGCRIILPPRLQIHRWCPDLPVATGEVSRFMIEPGFAQRGAAMMLLMRGIAITAREKCITDVCGVMPYALLRILRGYGIEMRPLLDRPIRLNGWRKPYIAAGTDLLDGIEKMRPDLHRLLAK